MKDSITITLTREEWDQIIDDLRNLESRRWCDDHTHSNRCFSEGRIILEGKAQWHEQE